MNKKKIVNSVLISFLVLMSLYFVVGALVEGNGNSGGTFYNVSTASGSIDVANLWWNEATNYTSNFTLALSGNSKSLIFNFTINNTNTVAFNGNATNVTIAFLGNLFQIHYGPGNISNHTYYWQAVALDIRTIQWYNYSDGTDAAKVYNGGLSNRTSAGARAWSHGYFQVNVSVNGTANTNTEQTAIIQVNISSPFGNVSSVSYTVGVDSLAPRITLINATDGSSVVHDSTGLTNQQAYFNNDSNISIRCTIVDANLNKTGNVTIWYNYTGTAFRGKGNSSNMTLGSCSKSGGVESCSYSAEFNLDGGQASVGRNMSFIIFAADYFGMTGNATNNEKAYNFTIKNVASIPQITVPNEKLIVFRSYTISCDGDANSTLITDATDSTTICLGTNACAGTFEPANAGKHVIQCETTDLAGNKQIVTQDVTVYSRSSTTGSSSGGSSSDTGAVVPTPTSIDISKEASTTGLSAGQMQSFSYDSASHNMKIDSVGSGTVTVTIDDKVTTTLEPAKPVEVDITGDGSKDVKLTLNKILLNKADITLEMLAGATKATTEEQTTQKAGSLTWLWVVLGIVVIAGVIWAIIAMKKK